MHSALPPVVALRRSTLVAMALLSLLAAAAVAVSAPSPASATAAARMATSQAPTSQAPTSQATTTPAPPPGVGIRLIDVPTATKTDPRARAYIIDNLEPGTTIARRVLLRNSTDATQHVRVYAAAAHVANDTFVGAKGTSQNQLSRWIAPALQTVTLAPHSDETDLVTIAVPKTATSGERFAAIWAEVSAERRDGGTAVTAVSRVGIRVYLSVGEGSAPASSFRLGSLEAHRSNSDKTVITAKVTNTGGRAIDVNGSLSLRDGPGSLRAGPFPITKVITLATGQSGYLSVPLSKGLPRGPWTATIKAKSGKLHESLAARITFPVIGSHRTTRALTGQPNWLLVAGVVLVLALIPSAAALSRRRRARRKQIRLAAATA